jgi:hypothetical protein
MLQCLLVATVLLAHFRTAARCEQTAAASGTGAEATPRRQAAVGELLRRAPKGTWAFVAADLDQLTASPATESVAARGARLARPFAPTAGALFLMHDGPASPLASLLLAVPGVARSALEDSFPGRGDRFTVEGKEAYGGPDPRVYVMLDDQTVVVSVREMPLAGIVRAYLDAGDSGMDERLAQVAQSLSGDLCAAFVAPHGTLGDCVPPDWAGGVLSPVARAATGTLTLRVGEGLELEGMLTFTQPEDAQAAATKALAYVERRRGALRQEAQRRPEAAEELEMQVTSMGKLRIEADEAELEVHLSLNPREVVALAGGPQAVRARELIRLADKGRANLHAIGVGIASYREAHAGASPPDLESLFRGGYLLQKDRAILVDPADAPPYAQGPAGIAPSCVYVGALPPVVPDDVIICYSRKGVYPDGRNVLRNDLAVDWVGEDQLQDPAGEAWSSLRASYEAVVKAFGNTLTEQRKAELKKFYEVQD